MLFFFVSFIHSFIQYSAYVHGQPRLAPPCPVCPLCRAAMTLRPGSPLSSASLLHPTPSYYPYTYTYKQARLCTAAPLHHAFTPSLRMCHRYCSPTPIPAT